MKLQPGVALQKVNFKVMPHIVKKANAHVLCYQINIEEESQKPLRMLLGSSDNGKKGYYYFTVPISHLESGHLVEHDIQDDGLEAFVHGEGIFWLDPDGSESRLDVIESKEGN